MLESDDGLQRLLNVSDAERAAAEADKAPPPKKRKGPPPRDYKYPAPTKAEVLAKIGATSPNKMVRHRQEASGDPYWEALRDKRCGTMEEIRWACNNAKRPPGAIQPEEPPSWWAYQLVLDSATPEGMARLRDEWAKTIPTKAEQANTDKLRDDGRALPILDGLMEELDAESAEGVQEEPGFPPGVDSPGE
jgi:hypothetical protein